MRELVSKYDSPNQNLYFVSTKGHLYVQICVQIVIEHVGYEFSYVIRFKSLQSPPTE